MTRAIFFILLAAQMFSLDSAAAAQPKVRRDVAYAEPATERNMLDVYAPAEGQNRPIVVWIHGGGWRQGNKQAVQVKPQAFVDRGFVFVSINHRFVPQVSVKEMTGDVAKAIRWMHDHASEFGGNPGSIFVMGHSAGAHLAALVCTDERYLKAQGLPLTILKGCVPVDTAAYDIPKRFADSGPAKAAGGQAIFGSDPAMHRELSPIQSVNRGKSIPPFLILHVADRPDSTEQSRRFAKALQDAGVYAQLVAGEGKTHGTINSELGVPGDKPSAALFEFVQARAAERSWISLFDGKTLDGWEVKGGKATYKVEDGTIVGTTVERSPNTFLCRGPYSDFELEFDVFCDKPLNSGVQIRSHTYEKDTPLPSKGGKIRPAGDVYGYQCEIVESEKGTAGNFWDEARRTKWLDDFSNKPDAQKAYNDGQWNHYRIVAQGDRIRSWVNGVPCADFRDNLDASGFIGLQVHSIPAGTGPYQVRWKNIRLRELKASEKVD